MQTGGYQDTFFDITVDLTHCDRVTGETMLKSHYVSLYLPGFERIARRARNNAVSCTQDGSGANNRKVNAARKDDAAQGANADPRGRLALLCGVHAKARTMTYAMSPVRLTISRLISLAITEQQPGKFARLRRIVQAEVVRMVRIHRSALKITDCI